MSINNIHRHGEQNIYGETITEKECQACIEEKQATENRFLTGTLNDKKIAYTNKTVFLIQTGRGKGSYKTRYSITGNLGEAVTYYNAINIGNGYKKRLVCNEFNKPVLARSLS